MSAIHSNPLVALAAILCGIIFGFALVLSDWKSKFTVGGIITAITGGVTTLTVERVNALKQFVEGTTLLTPLLYSLDIGLVVFLLSLFSGTSVVFIANFVKCKRANDPEAFIKAARRAVTILGNGLYRFIIAPPELTAANRIKELEKHVDVVSVMQKILVHEIRSSVHHPLHFKDSVDSIGRFLLQSSFGDNANLQHYRMAFFERRNDRLEYMVAINSRDWTSHSMVGFDLSNSFIGQAIRTGRPLIYPRDKKWKTPYSKRKNSRYKSFIVVPVPCGQSDSTNKGAITVDYTGKDAVFNELRVAELFTMAELVHVLYILNIKGDKNEKQGKSQSRRR